VNAVYQSLEAYLQPRACFLPEPGCRALEETASDVNALASEFVVERAAEGTYARSPPGRPDRRPANKAYRQINSATVVAVAPSTSP
jgi:hypothetical protein